MQHTSVHYGLDLQGGSELLYQVDPKEVDPTRNVDDVIDDTIEVISQRIYESKIVKDPRIQKQGTERILIQLPGLNQSETELIKREIETLGNLEFRLVASRKIGKEIDEVEERNKYEQARQKGRLAEYERGLLEKGYRWFAMREGKGVSNTLLWMNDGYNFTGTKFKRFYPTVGDEGQVIGFELKEEYKQPFARFTEKYKNQHMAILFNNKVAAAPNIKDRIPGQGIMVGFQPDEIKDLLRVLRSGSLEIQPELLTENSIGPSLGEDTVRIGIIAGAIGAALVVLFMSLYYLGLGLISSFCAILNVLLIGAVLVIFKETLTLPGIAGMMLTIGMSVDANILIFERIREEKRRRHDMALSAKETANSPIASGQFSKQEMLENAGKGFERAFTAIFDSNVTTLMTAIILYVFASGPVRGFAFTLGVGLIANFFTAIVVTRVFMYFGLETGVLKKLTMLDWVGQTRLPFTRYMPACLLCSITAVVLGMGLFFSRGDANYGLDLKGGLLAQISLEKPLTTEAVRTRLSQKFGSFEVQHIETQEGRAVEGWFDFAIRLPNLHQVEIEKADKRLREINYALRPKNQALQDYSNRITRLEEEQIKELRRELRNLEGEKNVKPRVDELNQRLKIYEEEVDKYRQAATELSKEIEQFKGERSKLMFDKNKLAGVEELRRTIESGFNAELSPAPFGKLQKSEKGPWSTYSHVTVNMSFAMAADVLRDMLKKQANFKQISLGSSDYYLLVKVAGEKTEAEISAELQKHLDLTARVSASQIKVEKVTSGVNAGYYGVKLVFQTPAPDFILREVAGKCGFQDAKILLSQAVREAIKSYELFVVLPWEMIGDKTSDELQKYVEENVRLAFKDKMYEGRTVYLSDPFPRFTQLSGVVAQAQKAKAVQAIILSLIALLIYIGFRFPNGFRFGFGSTMALAHDVMIALGCLALVAHFRFMTAEIDLTGISALLTLVGYSINNTIVIFDRLRENQQKNEVWDRLSYKAICKEFDVALNQTMSRTMFTSGTTLIVIIVMFVLNLNTGSALDSFAFILLAGMVAGTYSSWFLATNIVLMFEKKARVAE
jgi:protein-export membrane protein SecD/preprotein translocase SecF subunit